MENRKDIGKAIKDKLNSLDKVPGERVWISINEAIEKDKKRKKGLFYFWGTILGSLAISAIIIFNQSNQIAGLSIDKPKNVLKEVTINSSTVQTTTNGEGNATNSTYKSNETAGNKNDLLRNEKVMPGKINISTKNNIATVNTTKSTKLANSMTESLLSNSNQKSSRNNFAAASRKNKKSSSTEVEKEKAVRKAVKKSSVKATIKDVNLSFAKNDGITTTEKPTDSNSLQTSNDIKSATELKIEEKKLNTKTDKTITIVMHPEDSIQKDSLEVNKKYYVDVFASPTLYGYFSTESIFDTRLNSLDKNSEIKWSYGLGITYDFFEKISFRLGISNINLSYTTVNVPVDGLNYNGIVYKPSVSNQTILTASKAIAIQINGSTTMDVTQELSYIEIPLSIKYKFFDKKIGIKSSLGFSFLFLNENKVSIKTNNGYLQDIGKIKNLSQTTFSINVGLEVDYPVFTNTKIFMEPVLNYQFGAFSESASTPYIFGLRAGVRHSFNN